MCVRESWFFDVCWKTNVKPKRQNGSIYGFSRAKESSIWRLFIYPEQLSRFHTQRVPFVALDTWIRSHSHMTPIPHALPGPSKIEPYKRKQDNIKWLQALQEAIGMLLLVFRIPLSLPCLSHLLSLPLSSSLIHTQTHISLWMHWFSQCWVSQCVWQIMFLVSLYWISLLGVGLIPLFFAGTRHRISPSCVGCYQPHVFAHISRRSACCEKLAHCFRLRAAWFWPAPALWCEMWFMFGKLPLLRTQRVAYEMAYGCAYLWDAHIEPAGAVEGSTGSLGNGLCYDDMLK